MSSMSMGSGEETDRIQNSEVRSQNSGEGGVKQNSEGSEHRLAILNEVSAVSYNHPLSSMLPILSDLRSDHPYI